jgi:hypothetical protein
MTTAQKFLYTTLANIIFLFHLTLVFVVCLGWLFPSLFYVFLFLLFGTAFSEIFLGYCFLTKWEFTLRRKLKPTKEFDSSCIFHYGRALFGQGPRIRTDKASGGFIKKYSSLLILLLPLLGAVLVKYL